VGDEALSLTTGLWSIIDAEWVSDLDAGRRAASKPLQLACAAALGWRTPETYIGNDPNEVRRVWQRTRGRVVVKPFVLAGVPLDGSVRVPYTRPLERHDLADDDRIWASPAIWQEAIEKSFELRITVVGEQVFAGAIDSQASERTRNDWRRYDFDQVRHTPFELPVEHQARSRSIVKELGLRFGALDVIVTPAGEYVFLEINPFGQWLWMEQLCGLPIAAAHVGLFQELLALRSGSPDRIRPHAAVEVHFAPSARISIRRAQT
jgi:glutathione synthase/RimK-type ligase-like ATP-grasp enzyme